ncbi:MAG: DEAD/DEAH box helicase family protein [Rubricoccaceae bacterium]
MGSVFSSTRFRGTWRPYQARVLGELEAHLDDGRVHLVAPPGSGKTLLGLETVVRLGRPALVLAPTLALRDQWLARFEDLFESDVTTSIDVEVPATLTVTTYQALHTAARRGLDALVDALRAGEIGTLVVDEAHHLRQAWWRTLRSVRTELGNITTVALTATPPYDVPRAEWSRYSSFCGPPDADISIPELVKAGHLCPHLDLVRYVLPAPDEQARLDAFRSDTHDLIASVLRGGVWVPALERHPWIRQPEAHIDAIVDTGPEWFVAALAVLKEATDAEVTTQAAALDLLPNEVLELRTSLLDRFLTGVLGEQSEAFIAILGDELALRDLHRQLDRLGALDGSQVRLQHPSSVRSALAASESKLDAAVSAVRVESEARGEALRAVVLADRIRDAAWDPERGSTVLRQLGVVPLFERLRAAGLDQPIGVLTGRLVVVPADIVDELVAACVEAGIDGVESEPLEMAPGYMRVSGAGEVSFVRPITALFEAGGLRVLVGTVALLGEGWDAPSANVLVSASAAATFVRTGQIRGRVFRTDPRQPDKVSSVWHVACLDPSDPDGGANVAQLRRRFSAFAIPRAGDTPDDPPRLETGLGLIPTPATLDGFNAETDRRARHHAATRDLWRRAIGDDVSGRALQPSVRVRSPSPLPMGVRIRQVPWFVPSVPAGSLAGAGLASGLTGALIGLGQVAGVSMVGAGLALLAWGGTAFVRDTVRKAGRLRELGPAGVAVNAAAQATLSALKQAARVVDPEASVRVEPTATGIDVSLESELATDAEVFSEALTDVFSPIRSPRYLLRVEGGRTVAVPDPLGARKALAEGFAEAWRNHVGPAQLVFTRTPPGRRALATARARSLQRDDAVEQVHRWRG